MGKPRIFRLLALLLALSLLVGCGAPKEAESQSSAQQVPVVGRPQQLEHLTLGYVPGEGVNPYVSNSILVAQNAGLLFEKLVEIGPDMALDLRLAEHISSTGDQVVIDVRPGCRFADGTPIGAPDVLASFQMAQASEMYGGRFAGVLDARLQGDSVVLTLARPDSLFAYLCDIPVLKASEVELKQPTASGRYTYGGHDCLERNPHAPFPQQGPETVDLAAVDSYDAMTSGLTVGSLNLYAEADEAEAVPSIVSQEGFYRTNRLVYLGVNSARTENRLLATPQGRRLISCLADRRQLSDKSFFGRAYPATGAINGFYPCVDQGQVILAEQDAEAAAALLAQMGCTCDQMTGYYQDEQGKRLETQLLVYSGSSYKRYAAELLKEQLSAQGVEVHLVEIDDFEEYRRRVEAGEFDLYIGEVKMYNNMDITPFLSGGALSAGLAQTEALAQSYEGFRADQDQAAAFEAAFAADMPYVPLVWRTGTVVSSRGIHGVVSSVSNVFYSLQGLVIDKAAPTDS